MGTGSQEIQREGSEGVAGGAISMLALSIVFVFVSTIPITLTLLTGKLIVLPRSEQLFQRWGHFHQLKTNLKPTFSATELQLHRIRPGSDMP